MKYNKYIVAHAPGSSGTFITMILDRLILNSNRPINVYPNNSAHDVRGIAQYQRSTRNQNYTGISVPDAHASDIYDTFYFDRPGKTYSSILTTHVYPDFKKINEKYDDLGIIIIKFNEDDVKEILFNSFYKNKNVKLSNIELTVASKFLLEDYNNFMKLEDTPKNCLVLQYTDLFRDLSDSSNTINKIKEFTGISVEPDAIITAYYQYIEGRDRLVKDYVLR
jgi:hypothetical protein